MKKLKCEHCIHKKICIDGANYRNAEKCRNFINENDIAPVKHGHWDTGYFHDRVCSCCCHPDNDISNYAHSYCPNCGAKMDGGDDNDPDS